MACEGIGSKSGSGAGQSRTDASAIHGPLSAQVALLQSLILPAAKKDSAELVAGKEWKNGWSWANHLLMKNKLNNQPPASHAVAS